MNMPSVERIPALTDRLIEAARELLANPDDLGARRCFLERTFNSDWLAAKIVYLADRPTHDTGGGG
jgi:hypothetical protein